MLGSRVDVLRDQDAYVGSECIAELVASLQSQRDAVRLLRGRSGASYNHCRDFLERLGGALMCRSFGRACRGRILLPSAFSSSVHPASDWRSRIFASPSQVRFKKKPHSSARDEGSQGDAWAVSVDIGTGCSM